MDDFATAEHVQSTESFRDFDATVAVVEGWGWSLQESFIAAMLLKACGITAARARWLFDDAARRLQ